MKIRSLIAVLCALYVGLTALPSMAQDVNGECDFVYLFGAWARSTPEGAPTGAVYGDLINLSSETDTLVGAETDIADVVELHEMRMGEGDVMQMRPLESGIDIEPNQYQSLQPGGLHIMLIGLKQTLLAGSSFDLTLHFQQSGEVTITVPVVDMAATEADMGSMDMAADPATPAVSLAELNLQPACAKVHVLGAWARPAGVAMPNSAAYAMLLNLTAHDEMLVSAATDVSSVVELHEMLMAEGDVMQMRPVDGGIMIPAGGAVYLQPGGLHIMLIGLTQELVDAEVFDLTLNFAESESTTLPVPVREPERDGM